MKNLLLRFNLFETMKSIFLFIEIILFIGYKSSKQRFMKA